MDNNLGIQYNIDPKKRYLYDQIDANKDDLEIELVYVIAPPDSQDFTLRTAKLGKHVCCEKPMANSVAECQQMIGA